MVKEMTPGTSNVTARPKATVRRKRKLVRPQFKSFPKGDARRYFVVLESMVRLGDIASAHHIGLDIGASRAEVGRAVEAAILQFGVVIKKVGTVYQLKAWGSLDQEGVEWWLANSPLKDTD